MPNLKVFFLTAAIAFASNPTVNAADSELQELSLRDCIDLALQHNLNLQIERRNPLQAQYSIAAAIGGYYDPSLSISARTSSQVSGVFTDDQNRLVPGSESDTDFFSGNLNGTLPGVGTRYSVQANARETTGSRQVFDPISNTFVGVPFQSSAGGTSITVTQPLLRNFWIDGGRLNIALSKNNLRAVELTLKRQVMNVITQVERAYYDLIFAYDNVAVQELSLQLAQRSLDETRKRFEVGTVAELETKQTESQVAGRQAALLNAQRNLELQQNVLKRLISDNYLSVHRLVLKPTETLEAPIKVFDVQLSWDRGLSERPDLLQSRINLENNGLQLKYDKNQLFPQLDLQGSYGLTGSGVEYQDVFDRVTNRDQPDWFVGGTLTIPLGNRVARSNYRSRQTEEEQLLLTLKNLEQGIMVEIDDAIKVAASAYDQVQATDQARDYAQAALEAEQKRLESGKSTSFVVLSLQNDLTSARSSWIGAKRDYNNALAELSFREASTLRRHEIDWRDELNLE